MFKLIVKILVAVCALLAVIAGLNYKIDRYGYFQGGVFERSFADRLIDGENITNYSSAILDEREIMSIYVHNMPKAVDTAVIGSSRALQMTREFVPQNSTFFNFGVSGADFRDMVNTFYLMDKYDKLPKNMILVLDPWLFNGGEDALSPRSDDELYNEFLSVCLGYNLEYKKPDNSLLAEALFSPAILQENIHFYFYEKKEEENPDCLTTEAYIKTSDTRMADGSQLYSEEFCSRPQTDVDFDALSIVNGYFFRLEGMQEVDPELASQFEKFIIYAQDKGVKITFILPPYHPLVYDTALGQASRFPGFFEIEPYIRDFAEKMNITVYGSFDPLVSGCDSSDFYDGLHIRRESFCKIFAGFEGSPVYNAMHSTTDAADNGDINTDSPENTDGDGTVESKPEKIETARVPQA